MFELRRLKICTAMAFLTLLVVPWEASAQCRIGSGPDHGDGVPYCNDLGTKPVVPPRPKGWVDVYVSVAWHPDANDVWAIWNVRESQGGQAAADDAVLSDCRKAMGDGCSIANSGINTSIAIARDNSGFTAYGAGATHDAAKNQVLNDCSLRNTTCTVEHVFTAKPWLEYTDVAGFDELKQYRPNGRVIEARHGVAILSGNDGRKVWIGSGYETVSAAQAAVIGKCQAESAGLCNEMLVNRNGSIAIYHDENLNIGLVNGRNANDVRLAVRKICDQDRVKCTIIEIVNVKQPGFKVIDAAVKPVK